MVEKTKIELTPELKLRAMRTNLFVLEVEIEHLEDLLKFEKKEERKGRYEAGGGDPLPEDLAARFREKIIDLKNMHTMMTEAVRRAAAQTASGSAEREPT